MSEAAQDEEDFVGHVTLHFQVSFRKRRIVVAPDGTAHPLTIKCIKQNVVHADYRPVEIGPLDTPEFHAGGHDKHALLAAASRHRALLSAALALFDAEFAELSAALAGLPPPPPPPKPSPAC